MRWVSEGLREGMSVRSHNQLASSQLRFQEGPDGGITLEPPSQAGSGGLVEAIASQALYDLPTPWQYLTKSHSHPGVSFRPVVEVWP